MDLHFDRAGVEMLVAHARAGIYFAMPYHMVPGPEKPGLLLIVDEGIYLVSNSLVPADSLVVYARECNPDMPFTEMYKVKRRAAGREDSVMWIPLEQVEDALSVVPGDLVITSTPTQIALDAPRRKRSKAA